MKTLGTLCAALFLLCSATGCYYCSYEYDPCTGRTERVWHKIGDHDHETECGTISCGSYSCGGCGGSWEDCSCNAPEIMTSCTIPEPTCTLPTTPGCEIPSTCGCEMPSTCGCEVPATPGCEIPHCACNAPYYEGEIIHSPGGHGALPSAPQAIPPAAEPANAVGASYIVPSRRYH